MICFDRTDPLLLSFFMYRYRFTQKYRKKYVCANSVYIFAIHEVSSDDSNQSL